MKKGQFKKILASSTMGIMALTMPFELTGCDEDSDINVRVDGEYVQWQVEGSDSWTNLLTLDEIKDILGEEYKGDTGAQGEKGDKGDPGTNGINGKEVEFRSTDTHIQWRYVDSNQEDDENWEDLIALSSLKGEPGQDGKDSSFANYTINFDYIYSNMESLYDNYILSCSVNSTEWITSIPMPKDTVSGEFDGWYIKGTDKKIENYDFVGGNVTLEARWKVLPSGIYSSSKYINDWDYLEENYLDVNNGVVVCNSQFRNYLQTISSNGKLKLVIDSSITEIGNNAFAYSNSGTISPCTQIISVFIPESVTKIGYYAFYGSGIESVSIPDSVNEIGNLAFAGCSNLQNIVLPKNLTNLSTQMFYGDESLMNITLPNSLTTIEDGVFSNCISLTKIVIPASVSEIGKDIFRGCYSLEHLSVESGNTTYHSWSNISIIETNTKTLLYGCPEYIPSDNSVTKIGDYAFCKNTNLETIDIWYMIESIGNYAFYGCEKLETVFISSETIANSLASASSHGYLTAYAQTIYISSDINVANSTYLSENFTKQETSDNNGFDMYVRNSSQS